MISDDILCGLCLRREAEERRSKSYSSGSKFHTISSASYCKQAICELIIVVSELNIFYICLYMSKKRSRGKEKEQEGHLFGIVMN